MATETTTAARAGRKIASAALAWLAAAALATSAPAARVTDLSGLAGGYRQVLASVAAGDQQGAVELLVGLELEAIGESPSPRRTEELWRIKLGVIAELLESSPPDMLVPVILLHHDVYLEHRRERRRQLANHARTMAVELVEFYLSKTGGAGDSKAVASRILTSFGGYLQAGWSMGLASELFRRSLELDPANQAAILGMAAGYEKLGRYREAVEYLERALAVSPDDPQVGLRLAICRARLADDDRAAAELRQLIARQPPPWILALAYQELVGLEVASGDSTAALLLVREGLERLPGDPHLAVQETMLLDRTRQRREATRVVEALVPPDWAEESPRYRYTRWPSELLEIVRQQLRGDLAARREQLRASLDRPGQVAGG